MIIIPGMDQSTFIHEGKFCSVGGFPNQIAQKLIMMETPIDDHISIIAYRFKDIQIMDTGDMSVMLYRKFFDQHQIRYSVIKTAKGEEFFGVTL